MDISQYNNLDDLILTEKDMNIMSNVSNNMSEEEINELCKMLLENDELIEEFKETNKWLKLTNDLEDEHID